MKASDWLLPDADCVGGLVLPLALTNSHDVGASGGHTGGVPENINQALVSLKKPSLNTTYFVILPGESFAAKAFTRRVLPHPWVPKYGF